MYQGQDAKFVSIFPPQAIVNTGSWTILSPGYLDTFGFHNVTYAIQLGATDIAMTVLKLTECETTGGSYTDVPLTDYSVLPLTLPAASGATGDNSISLIRCPVNGLRMRYQKLVATTGTGSAGTYLSCLAILGNPDNAPYNAATAGAAQIAQVAG